MEYPKIHYCCSLTTQGLLQCIQSIPSSSSLLPSLWSHEAVRVFCDGVSRERDYLWFHEVLRPLESQIAKILGLQVEGNGRREFVVLTSLPLDHQSVKEARESGLTAVPKVLCVHLHDFSSCAWQASLLTHRHHLPSPILSPPFPLLQVSLSLLKEWSDLQTTLQYYMSQYQEEHGALDITLSSVTIKHLVRLHRAIVSSR